MPVVDKETLEEVWKAAKEAAKLVLHQKTTDIIIAVTLLSVLVASKAQNKKELVDYDDVLYFTTSPMELARLRDDRDEIVFTTEVGDFAIISADNS